LIYIQSVVTYATIDACNALIYMLFIKITDKDGLRIELVVAFIG